MIDRREYGLRVERAAAQGRLRARERRQARGLPRARARRPRRDAHPRTVGQPAARLAQHAPAAAARASCCPAGVELELFDQLAAIPPYSEDDEHDMPPAVAALKAAIAGADAVLVATPEYNALDAGRAQERARLGLAAGRRDAAAGQARGGDRREHGPVRGGLGAGRDAQGARRRSARGWSTASCPWRRPRRPWARTGCRWSEDAREALSAATLDELIELAGARRRLTPWGAAPAQLRYGEWAAGSGRGHARRGVRACVCYVR